MKEKPYPYNQPPWRRSWQVTSPNGQWTAKIDYALEICMSGPTSGQLEISNVFKIPNCNPAFIWSDDSLFLAVPQWKYRFHKRERLLIVDMQQKQIFASPSKFRLFAPDRFEKGVITGTDSDIWKTRQVRIDVNEHLKRYKRIDQDRPACVRSVSVGIIKRISLLLFGSLSGLLGFISIVMSLVITIGAMVKGFSDIDDLVARIYLFIWMSVISELFLAFGIAASLLGLRCVFGPRGWVVRIIDYFWSKAVKLALILPLIGLGFAAIAAIAKLCHLIFELAPAFLQ
jgi:hypothetical protein